MRAAALTCRDLTMPGASRIRPHPPPPRTTPTSNMACLPAGTAVCEAGVLGAAGPGLGCGSRWPAGRRRRAGGGGGGAVGAVADDAGHRGAGAVQEGSTGAVQWHGVLRQYTHVRASRDAVALAKFVNPVGVAPHTHIPTHPHSHPRGRCAGRGTPQRPPLPTVWPAATCLATHARQIGELFLGSTTRGADAACLLQRRVREDDADSSELLFGGRAAAGPQVGLCAA